MLLKLFQIILKSQDLHSSTKIELQKSMKQTLEEEFMSLFKNSKVISVKRVDQLSSQIQKELMMSILKHIILVLK
jgi:hypothetical protein